MALSANGVLGLTLFFFVTNGAELFDLLYISDDDAIDHVFCAKNDDNASSASNLGGKSVS